jgi:hypothetical protein
VYDCTGAYKNDLAAHAYPEVMQVLDQGQGARASKYSNHADGLSFITAVIKKLPAETDFITPGERCVLG